MTHRLAQFSFLSPQGRIIYIIDVIVIIYRQTSNISRTFVGDNIVDHSNVVGASPIGAALTTSSSSNQHLASMDWTKTTTSRDEKI